MQFFCIFLNGPVCGLPFKHFLPIASWFKFAATAGLLCLKTSARQLQKI